MSDPDQNHGFPSVSSAKSHWEQLANNENGSSTSLSSAPDEVSPRIPQNHGQQPVTIDPRPIAIQSNSFPAVAVDLKVRKIPPPTKPKPQRLISKAPMKDDSGPETLPTMSSLSLLPNSAESSSSSKPNNSSRPPTPPVPRFHSPAISTPVITRSSSPFPSSVPVHTSASPHPTSLTANPPPPPPPHSRNPSLLSPDISRHGTPDPTSSPPKPPRPVSPKPYIMGTSLSPTRKPPRPRSPAPQLSRSVNQRVVSAGEVALQGAFPRPAISRQHSKTPPPELQRTATLPARPISRAMENCFSDASLGLYAPPALPPRPSDQETSPPKLPPRSAELLPAIRLDGTYDRSSPVETRLPHQTSLPKLVAPYQTTEEPTRTPAPVPPLLPRGEHKDALVSESQVSESIHGNTQVPVVPEASASTAVDYEGDDLAAGGYPDSSRVNRRPPIFEGVLHEISGKSDIRAVINLGSYFCVGCSGATYLYDSDSGAVAWSATHSDTRVTAAAFVTDHLIWMGTKDGCLWEVQVNRSGVATKRANVHLQPVTVIRRCLETGDIWTLSDDGKLVIWTSPSVSSAPKTYRVTPAFKACAFLGKSLWIGRNKQLFVYEPTTVSLNVNPRPILAAVPNPSSTQPGANVVATNGAGVSGSSIGLAGTTPTSAGTALSMNHSVRQMGEFTCATSVTGVDNFMFFGHEEGTITVFCHSKMAAVANVNVSIHKICSLSKGDINHLWIGLKTGVILVCDVSQVPWRVLKEWKAHEGPVSTISCQPANNCLPVMSLSVEGSVRIWDGLLKHDWIEMDLNTHDSEFSRFQSLRTQIVTWNTGAARPNEIDGAAAERNAENIKRSLITQDRRVPDIIVFGFQELVELDNKSVTAKTMFRKNKKSQEKDIMTSSHISSQYKAWQDRLDRLVADACKDRYRLVHSNNMVGLFTCVFIREEVMPRVRSVKSSAVKTGLGGLHGNKGGLVVRVLVDDSSICFVNCHLAAGQSGILQRNADIETILQSPFLDPSENANLTSKGIFANGGDGTMILDHEICFFSGDMNYRIAKLRPIAIKAIQDGALSELLEADQLIVQLKKNPGMRLRAFTESPISFAPTYKFDVGTDNYDTSEKKRVPAWCDRIFYRGGDRIHPIDYKSVDVYVSDHKPVTGIYDVDIKTIDPSLRKDVYKESLDRWRNHLSSKYSNLLVF